MNDYDHFFIKKDWSLLSEIDFGLEYDLNNYTLLEEVEKDSGRFDKHCLQFCAFEVEVFDYDLWIWVNYWYLLVNEVGNFDFAVVAEADRYYEDETNEFFIGLQQADCLYAFLIFLQICSNHAFFE